MGMSITYSQTFEKAKQVQARLLALRLASEHDAELDEDEVYAEFRRRAIRCDPMDASAIAADESERVQDGWERLEIEADDNEVGRLSKFVLC